MSSGETRTALARLYTAVVADVLDMLGYRQQTLAASIRALTPATQVCGRVFTARVKTVEAVPAEPYKLEMEAIDSMARGAAIKQEIVTGP